MKLLIAWAVMAFLCLAIWLAYSQGFYEEEKPEQGVPVTLIDEGESGA